MRKIKGPARFLVMLIAAAAFCEAVLWAAGYPDWRRAGSLTGLPEYFREDAAAGWSSKPGSYQYSDPSDGKQIKLTFLEDGSRKSSSADSSAGSEMFLLGDSYVMGHGLGDEDTFAWKMQEALQSFRIRNFGVGGYGTCQVLLQSRGLADGSAAKPRWALYFLSSFHEERNIGSPLSVQRQGESAARVCRASAGESGALKVLLADPAPRWKISETWRGAALIEEAWRVAGVWLRAGESREVTRRLIGELSELWRGAGGTFLVVLLDVNSSARESYSAWFKQEGIPFLDCSDALEPPGERLADGHPGKIANGRIAKCVSAGFFGH